MTPDVLFWIAGSRVGKFGKFHLRHSFYILKSMTRLRNAMSPCEPRAMAALLSLLPFLCALRLLRNVPL